MIKETGILDNILYPEGLFPDETVYFDIETTGFSADVTALYLIGCIYFKNGKSYMLQWFSESDKDEKEMLTEFANFIKDKKYLICYNGITFDIPYLKKKYNKWNLEFNIDDINVIDYYRKFFAFKNFLGLTGLRQKDIETYLNISRKDTFSGGELIKWYYKYLKLRFTDNFEKDNIYKSLILHNNNDLIGLSALTRLYDFASCIERLSDNGDLLIRCELNDDKLILATELKTNFIKEINIEKDSFLCRIYENKTEHMTMMSIATNLLKTELKLFYKDYKNYYYLPKEDMIVHKSLAAFVDKGKKEKAGAENCYTKHSGTFIRIPEELNLQIFKKDYNDKDFYVLADDVFFNAKGNLRLIFKSVLGYIK